MYVITMNKLRESKKVKNVNDFSGQDANWPTPYQFLGFMWLLLLSTGLISVSELHFSQKPVLIIEIFGTFIK